MNLYVSIVIKLYYLYELMIREKNISTLLFYFLLTHLLLWTLAPSLTNKNLPLDTIEHLAWASNLDWGFAKHPPLVAFVLKIFFQIFENRDWAYYILSQIFVLISFYFVWKLSSEFLQNKILSLISILLLEGIYFYNFTTPEFNVNVCLLPFWSMAAYYCWQSFQKNKIKDWILFGLISGLGFLSKYLFLYLLVGLVIFFIFFITKKTKFSIKYLIPVFIFLIIISPHLLWLFQNDFITLKYAINRTGLERSNLIDHVYFPLLFLIKQIGILIPFLIMVLMLVKKFKINIKFKDPKLLYLISINILPIALLLITSLITGSKIRTMWLTPFYLFLGLITVYIFQTQIDLKKLKKFIITFFVIFIISPSIYTYISISKTNKRTDFPGKEIAYLVQTKWDQNFSNNITIVVGDEWLGGNLSYHLASRPKWFNKLDKKTDIDGGVLYVGNPNILKKVCPGLYGTIKPFGICMIGKK